MAGMNIEHNKFESCKNCPHRSIKCHTTCKGYIYRQECNERRKERIREAKRKAGR